SSAHAHALLTLEKEGHPRDPDCVSCHVVGLQFSTGFKSRQKTPQLANIGCESCHGAGAKHAAKPSLKLRKLTEQACLPCHTTENSPHFDFKTYWKKIRH
ncbi:MAG TPA: multiheme c-type cytochrome, partial [Fimbriimonas sp.]|nr:multiheme c-type cytochrome [Fimbriimonas sp.]